MMKKAIIGVDPGKAGGFVLLSNDSYIVPDMLVMPIAGKDIDLNVVIAWIHDMKAKCALRNVDIAAYIEKVGAMPSQGVTSMFSFGYNTGVIHGILASLHIPRFLVTPQAWKKEILSGTLKDKDAAKDWCTRIYPGINLIPYGCRKIHDGLADALCIATYGLNRHDI